jgi:O-antigen ligase
MVDGALAAGAIAAAAAAAAGIVVRRRRMSAVCMALALAVAAALLASDRWDDPRVVDLRESEAVLAAAIVAASVVIAALAVAIRRIPALFVLLAVAALPFRIPIDLGGETSNLLLPLYAVIAAGVAAAIWAPEADGREQDPPLPPGFPGSAARWLPLVLAALVVLYAVQLTYSDDFSNGLQNLCFFYLPYSALFALLLRVRWSAKLLLGVLGIVVAEAALFALVAFVQHAARDIFWNPDVQAANLFHPYFRVNSLFWDPNILARYLAVVTAVLAAVVLATRSPKLAVAATATAIVLIAAMVLTFSQTGFVALLAGLVILAALRWSARWTLALGGIAAAAAVAFVLAGGAELDFSLERENVISETSGRSELISGGLELAEDHPVVGIGSGSFSQTFEERFGSKQAAATVSHTEPVTILAEQGAVGLLLYVAMLAIAIASLLAGIGPLAPGLRGFAAAPERAPPAGGEARTVLAVARWAVIAAFVVMLVHSLAYAAFLIDPITWTLLAMGLALVRDPLTSDTPER